MKKRTMQTTRILLPFTQDLNLGALEYAIQFARSCRAMLIPLILLPLSAHQWMHSPCLEAIEQAVDFLEAVRWKAIRADVPIESYDLQTHDVVRSIRAFAQEMMCEGILLFQQEGAALLLPTEIVKCLLEQAPCKRYLVHLQPSARTGRLSILVQRCLNRIRQWQGQRKKEVLPRRRPSVPGGEMLIW